MIVMVGGRGCYFHSLDGSTDPSPSIQTYAYAYDRASAIYHCIVQ